VESTPRISFIIPVYNGLELTRECLRTLTDTVPGSDHEIILVDDGSTDGTRPFLTSLDRADIRVVFNERNLGFGPANNAAARIARGDFLCLINNDLVFTPDWLEPMIRAFDSDRRIGVVGNIQTTTSSGAIDHAGVFIGLDGKPQHRRKLGLAQRWRHYSRFPAVTGACMMIRRSDFLELDGFDRQFVNGAEDIDLCFRMEKHGKRIVVANRSMIGHHVSASRGTSSRDEENCRKLFAKWPDHLARLGARRWPAHTLRSMFRRRTTLRPGRAFKALLQGCGLSSKPDEAGLALVRHRMAVTESHWEVQLGNGTSRRKPSFFREFQYDGFHPSAYEGTTWIKEKAQVRLPAGIPVRDMHIRGVLLPAPSRDKPAEGMLGLRMRINGTSIRTWRSIPEGSFTCELEAEPLAENIPSILELELLGTTWTNALAWIGRKTADWSLPRRLHAALQSYRPQRLNQRLQISRIAANGEDILDFTRPSSPFVYDFAQRHTRLGFNLIGWFTGELGVGESVRCAARAIEATRIPHAFVNSRLNCLAAQGDKSYLNRLQEDNPYPINIFHLDAPQSNDIDHHHGTGFRKGRYNIAYWAWELPEFPDRWIRAFSFFDEIWTPSRFTTEAITRKSPLPVLTMPHAIEFTHPAPGARGRMNLPVDRFLFLMMYDLNSYQERKNPRAVIDAYARAFPGGRDDVGLVIKVHSVRGNETAFDELQQAVASLKGVHLISRTLPRSAVYDLIAACDCFVSLHRSEGFGLGIAEAMYLEKPVISTNWSATEEFVNSANGCPVDFELVALERTIGPYGKGQIWADPDLGHAVRYMQKVVDDAAFCREAGHNARQTILKRFAPRVIGSLYEHRLRAITLW